MTGSFHHSAVVLLGLLLLFGCQTTTVTINDEANTAAFVVVHLQSSYLYHDSASGSDKFGLCILVNATCIGSPWPTITSIIINGRNCVLNRGKTALDGISYEGYHLTDSIDEEQEVTVLTSVGSVKAAITMPRTKISFIEPSSDIPFGSDFFVRWLGDAEHYRVLCDIQDSLYTTFASIDTVVDATCLFMPASRLPDHAYGFDVTIQGYNGSIPGPGAVGNMQGDFVGFLSAENMHADNFFFQDFFIVR